MAVQEGHAASVMTAYNKRERRVLRGERTPAATTILKGDWGFRGFVESDWFVGTRSTVPSAKAGLDIEMPGPAYYGASLSTAVTSGEVPMALDRRRRPPHPAGEALLPPGHGSAAGRPVAGGVAGARGDWRSRSRGRASCCSRTLAPRCRSTRASTRRWRSSATLPRPRTSATAAAAVRRRRSRSRRSTASSAAAPGITVTHVPSGPIARRPTQARSRRRTPPSWSSASPRRRGRGTRRRRRPDWPRLPGGQDAAHRRRGGPEPAHGRRARGQRRADDAVARTRPGGPDGVVSGPAGRDGHRRGALRRRDPSGKLPVSFPRRRPTCRRSTTSASRCRTATSMATAGSIARGSRRCSRSASACRTRRSHTRT